MEFAARLPPRLKMRVALAGILSTGILLEKFAAGARKKARARC